MSDCGLDFDEHDLFNFALTALSPVDDSLNKTKRTSSHNSLPRSLLGTSKLSRHQLGTGVRSCLRCGKLFSVNPKNGTHEDNDPCRYHPGTVAYDEASDVKIFTCCDRISNPYTEKQGCLYGGNHIHDCRLFELVRDNCDNETLHSFQVRKRDEKPLKIVALGIAPLFSINGIEYGRVALVDSSYEIVYEQAITPFFKIADYNTPCCKISPDNENMTTSLWKVSGDLQSLLGDDTVVVLGNRWKLAKQFFADIGFGNKVTLRTLTLQDGDAFNINKFRNLSSNVPADEAIAAMRNLISKFYEFKSLII